MNSEALQLLRRRRPERGELAEVAPGIRWLSLPLPLDLKHVNCWFIDDGDAAALVDCGPDTADCRDIWNGLVDRAVLPSGLSRLLVTHGHVDHCGLSGWMTSRFDMPVLMTLVEWQSARLRHLAGVDSLFEKTFMESHGVPAAVAEASFGLRRRNTGMMGPQPGIFQRLRDGDEIVLGERPWRVIAGGGHTDDHACFYDPAGRILVAGDQVLSHITPLIAVYYEQPGANPLADYFATLSRLRDLPHDVLVLPSHGQPFVGLHGRIAYLMTHHERRLDELRAALREPKSGYELSAALFPRAYDTDRAWLALAETIAHLNFLLARGEVRHVSRPDGVPRAVIAS